MGDISDKLREAYEKKGLSYQELSKLCYVPRATIQRYVMGTTDRIDIDKLQEICRVLEVDAAELLGWKERMQKSEDEKLNEEIFRLFSSLSHGSKLRVLAYAQGLKDSEETKEAPSSAQ